MTTTTVSLTSFQQAFQNFQSKKKNKSNSLESSLEDATKYISHILKVIPSFYSNFEEQILSGTAGKKLPSQFRRRFYPLFKAHVADVILKYFRSNLQGYALELGADVVVNEKQSYLSSALPETCQWKLTHSDPSPLNVQFAKDHKFSGKFIHLDSKNILGWCEKATLDAVIAASYLDTLPALSLYKTLEQIYDALKDGGLLFHISDLQPCVSNCILSNKDRPFILFPLIGRNGFFEGLQMVTRKKCEALIESWESSGVKDAAFLKRYLDLSNDVRAGMLIELFGISQVLPLSNWVKEKFAPNDVTILYNDQFFTETIEQAFKASRFTVLTCGIEGKQQLCPRTELDPKPFDDVSAIFGYVDGQKRNFPQNLVRKSSFVHIIVAKKATDLLNFRLLSLVD